MKLAAARVADPVAAGVSPLLAPAAANPILGKQIFRVPRAESGGEGVVPRSLASSPRQFLRRARARRASAGGFALAEPSPPGQAAAGFIPLPSSPLLFKNAKRRD